MSATDQTTPTIERVLPTPDVTRPLAALREVPAIAARPEPVTISGREVERLTGVSPERLRTWERRFGFPQALTSDDGFRAFVAGDVPEILAIRQLIESGYRVADAVEQVRTSGVPVPDPTALRETFERVPSPVVALSGPEPLAVLWANRAARELCADGQELRVPDVQHASHRVLQRVLIAEGGTSCVVRVPNWAGADDAEDLPSVAWTVGAPTFTPAIALVMGLPAGDEEGDRTPAEARAAASAVVPVQAAPAAAWIAAVRDARRTLQRGVGGATVTASLAALVNRTGADDGFVLRSHAGELRTGLSARGTLHTATLDRRGHEELDAASRTGEVTWLTRATCDELTDCGSACLAIPLMSGGGEQGFAVLQFAEKREVPVEASELLLAWGAAAAWSLSRDRVVALRRRIAQHPNR